MVNPSTSTDAEDQSILFLLDSYVYAKNADLMACNSGSHDHLMGCRFESHGHLPLDNLFATANLVKLDMTKIVDGRHSFDLGVFGRLQRGKLFTEKR